MELALELAELAKGRTTPNPMVGAVIVKDGKIVGTGYHQKAGTPHAEVHALREAGDEAQDAQMYVTLEPCNHHGRTPPCTEAIIKSGIKKVICAMVDPNPLVAGQGLERLRKHGIEVISGILAKEAQKLNEVFIKHITTNVPFISLKAAYSLDGKIATTTGESMWITGNAARLYGHELRNTYDAIMTGVGTVLMDNPSLTCRLPEGKGRNPTRIIVDSKLNTPINSKILNQDSDAETIIATTIKADMKKARELSQKAKIIWVNDGDRVDLQMLSSKLKEIGITSILVEGGGTLNASLLELNLIDKYYLFLAPKLIGGANAPGAFGGKGIIKLKDALDLQDISITNLDKDYLFIAYPRKEEQACLLD